MEVHYEALLWARIHFRPSKFSQYTAFSSLPHPLLHWKVVVKLEMRHSFAEFQCTLLDLRTDIILKETKSVPIPAPKLTLRLVAGSGGQVPLP